MQNKLGSIICLLLACLFLLTGCRQRRPISSASSEFFLPEPEEHPVQMILGEQIASRPEPIALQYVSSDGSTFSTINRTIIRSESGSIWRSAIETYLNSMNALGRMTFIPDELTILDIYILCGIVTVNLSLDALRIESEQEQLMFYASIANTLLSLNGVKGVQLLVHNRAIEIQEMPLGVIVQPFQSVTPTYAQMAAELDYFLRSGTGSISRYASIYYPTVDGRYFLPEIREIAFEDDDYASAILRAMRAGSNDHEIVSNPIPESVELLTESPIVQNTPNGEHVLKLSFSPTFSNYLTFSGLDEWELLGAITLSILSFMPNIDAIEAVVDGQPIDHCMHNDLEIDFNEGIIRMEDFVPYTSSSVTIYSPLAEGKLSSMEYSISDDRENSPYGRMELLLHVIHQTFLSTIDSEDLLGISVNNQTACINLSSNFYRACQNLSDAQEFSLVYSMVNSLCELESISEVQIMVEGRTPESLGGEMYLKGTLLPNPGISSFPQLIPIANENGGNDIDLSESDISRQ